MKYLSYIVVALVVIGGGWYYWSHTAQQTPQAASPESQITSPTADGATVVQPGTYTVVADKSIVHWAGKKPLVEGYVDSGTIGVKEGTITSTADTASGSFVIDMTSLRVGLTAKKPGMESKLEEHLKKGDFFDVTTYPTAKFVITKVTPRSDSATTFMYDVTGDLTMKGKTNAITFPAKIFMKDGMIVAEATTAIDRTKWGITFGSKSFFDNLADNFIDDMVQLDFTLVATKAK